MGMMPYKSPNFTDAQHDMAAEYGQMYMVVMAILEANSSRIRGCTLAMDRRFMAMPLVVDAKRDFGVDTVGTIMKNRKYIPSPIATLPTGKGGQPRVERGFYQGLQATLEDGIVLSISCCRDSKDVLMLATVGGLHPATVERGSRGTRDKNTFQFPTQQKLFNDTMGGVDINGQRQLATHSAIELKRYKKAQCPTRLNNATSIIPYLI